MGVSSTSTLWFRPNRSRIFLGIVIWPPPRHPHDASVRNPAALFHAPPVRTVAHNAASCIRSPGTPRMEEVSESWEPQRERLASALMPSAPDNDSAVSTVSTSWR